NQCDFGTCVDSSQLRFFPRPVRGGSELRSVGPTMAAPSPTHGNDNRHSTRAIPHACPPAPGTGSLASFLAELSQHRGYVMLSTRRRSWKPSSKSRKRQSSRLALAPPEALEERRLLSTIRTIAYNQITSQPASNPLTGDPFNTLSADGHRAVF